MSELPRIFYTIEEVAQMCGVSKSTIEKAVRDGELLRCKIGKKLTRIHVDDLLRWGRSLTVTPSALDCLPLVRSRIQVIEKRTGTE